MEALCMTPIFFIFLIAGLYAQSQKKDSQTAGWTQDDDDLMEDIVMLDMLDDEDNW